MAPSLQRREGFVSEVAFDLDVDEARMRVPEPRGTHDIDAVHVELHRVGCALEQALHERTARRGHDQRWRTAPEQPQLGREALRDLGVLPQVRRPVQHDAVHVDSGAEWL